MPVRTLAEVVAVCDDLSATPGFPDFPEAHNGLQVENSGRVARLGAAVDIDLATAEAAASRGIDFVIVHHGLLWKKPTSYCGALRRKLATLFAHDIAVYASHLPLDAHPTLGNNARLAGALGLIPDRGFIPYGGRDIGLLCAGLGRADLVERLRAVFPGGVRALELGPETLRLVALCSGAGGTAIAAAVAAGADALVTGEIRHQDYTEAAESGLNVYLCGHYATETFGVCALAEAVANRLGLPWEFLPGSCPL